MSRRHVGNDPYRRLASAVLLRAVKDSSTEPEARQWLAEAKLARDLLDGLEIDHAAARGWVRDLAAMAHPGFGA